MNFDQFMRDRLPNAWVGFRHMEIYVRKNAVWPGLIDLANMTSDQPGSGDLRAFLDRYSGEMPFYVENVHNPRLADFFRKQDWFECRTDPACFLNHQALLSRLGPGFIPSPRGS